MAAPSQSDPRQRSEPDLPAEVIARQLEKILASPVFAGSDRMIRFLRFTVEYALQGKAEEIKEYLIGVEVFDRKTSFDPRSDAVVRGEARRLRSKLMEYYEGEGRDDAVRIDFPKGGYVPVFQRKPLAVTTEQASPSRSRPPTKLALISGCCVLLGALLVWFGFRAGRKGMASPQISSIAVLPFLDISPQKDQEYFCEGMTEELIHALSKIEGLRVPARTSVYQLKGAGIDKIGEQLHVTAVLEGSIRKEGDRARVTAQLVRVSDNTHLWSETYDRDVKSVFAIQEEIARSVVSKLRIQLAGGTNRPLVKRATEDVEAYNLYSRGRYYFYRGTPAERGQAIAFFQQSIAKDPNYAQAYAGLSSAYASLDSPKADCIKANEAATKALSLDGTLAEAHRASAMVKVRCEFDWPGGERELQRALELNPNDSNTHRSYAIQLANQGRFKEAIREAESAIQLDPMSPEAHYALGDALYFSRRYDETIQQSRKVLSIDPAYIRAYHTISRCYSQKGMYPEAIRAAAGWALPGADMSAMWILGYAYGRAGREADALKIIGNMKRVHDRERRGALGIAYVYSGIGDKEQTLKWLEINYEDLGYMSTLKVAPELDLIRSEPRYIALLKKIGLGP